MLMATLPGLPMFGHGQIEGYHEKYGMEYRRAYWDEYPDTYLINRHQREIFPLLHKRYLFADVENFLLYDFYAPEGHVNENVFVYSNSSGFESSLVIYHNRWADAKGWVKTSAAYLDKNQDDGVFVQRDIAEGLALQNDDQIYTIFRDHITGLEYIRNNREIHERGLYFELAAYKYHVFLDFRQVADNEWGQYAQLHHHLKRPRRTQHRRSDQRNLPAAHSLPLQRISQSRNVQMASGQSGACKSKRQSPNPGDYFRNPSENGPFDPRDQQTH